MPARTSVVLTKPDVSTVSKPARVTSDLRSPKQTNVTLVRLPLIVLSVSDSTSEPPLAASTAALSLTTYSSIPPRDVLLETKVPAIELRLTVMVLIDGSTPNKSAIETVTSAVPLVV